MEKKVSLSTITLIRPHLYLSVHDKLKHAGRSVSQNKAVTTISHPNACLSAYVL